MASGKKMKVLGLAAGIAVMLTLAAVTVAASHSAAGTAPSAMSCGSDCGSQNHGKTSDDKQAKVYTCPMHPEVVSSEPGKCPKCGMNLVPKK